MRVRVGGEGEWEGERESGGEESGGEWGRVGE